MMTYIKLGLLNLDVKGLTIAPTDKSRIASIFPITPNLVYGYDKAIPVHTIVVSITERVYMKCFEYPEVMYKC